MGGEEPDDCRHAEHAVFEEPVAGAMNLLIEGGQLPEVLCVVNRVDLLKESQERMLDNFLGNVDMLAGAMAARSGRDASEMEVRAFAGALTGAMIAAIYAWVESGAKESLWELLDRALVPLEAGFNV